MKYIIALVLLGTAVFVPACGDDDCSKDCKATCKLADGYCIDEVENDDGTIECKCRSNSSSSSN